MGNKKSLLKLFLIILAFFISLLPLKYYLFYSQKVALPDINVKLNNGDIILRKELNHISDMFAKINNSDYSHIGTILIVDGEAKVIHIEDTSEEQVFKETNFNEFVQYASSFVIYRPRAKINQANLLSAIEALKENNPVFDITFKGDNQDNSLYCTELAYYLYNISIDKKLPIKKAHYLNFEFIPIDMFSDSNFFQLIYKK